MRDERDLLDDFDETGGESTSDTSAENQQQNRIHDPHEMPTMPIPREPGTPDPKATLPGTGGMDPNPDFEPPFDGENTIVHQYDNDNTVPHQVTSDDTVQHYVSQPTQPISVRQPAPSDHQRFQRPAEVIPAPQAPAPYKGEQAPVLPPKPAKARRKKILGMPSGCVMLFIGVITSFCGGLTLISLAALITAGARVDSLVQERVALVDDYQAFESTFYYDRDGELLYETFDEGRRTNVDYSEFPQILIDATVATEDDTFWSNPGIEVEATFRAFLQYIGVVEGFSGGSTITQQVVDNILFTYEYRNQRTIRVKVDEILLALALNQRKSKEEIMELYLNEIYYGNLAYGAQAASQVFFSKDVGELTLGEAALLAGLPQAPANLDPLNPDPDVQSAVNNRWRIVLDRMVAEGFITEEERAATLRAGLSFSTPDVPLNAPHFTVYAQQELEQLMLGLGYTPEQITRGGLQVYTTVDLDVHELAENAARRQIANLTANNVGNAAVLVTKPLTGEILAMVGSVDYDDESIDGRVNVAISPRQPGSTMKAFTYALALEQGMTPGDVIWDTPTSIGIPGQPQYVPRNYDNAFHGPMILRRALANSYNIPAVQTLRQVGVAELLQFMQRVGVDSLQQDASQYGLSLTLGGGEITLLELTRGYSVFANGGSYVETTSILCIVDGDGNILYEYEDGCPGSAAENSRSVQRNGLGRQVVDPRIAFLISDILSDNPARTPAMGANSPLNTGGLVSAVKTGTTNDVKDNWTVGYTRNVAVGVWVGNSRGEPMVNSSGLTGAAPIWNEVITGIYNNTSMLNEFGVDGRLQQDVFSAPGGMTLREICDIRNLRDPATGCTSTLNEWFLDGPAGIPDGDGGFNYPPAPAPEVQRPPEAGPWLEEVSPGVFRVLVQPIDPGLAAAITFNSAPGDVQPLPPRYCQVPIEVSNEAIAGGAREQWFIQPPPVPEDAIRAEEYARNNGLAFLPTIACTLELLQAAPVGGSAVTAFIQQPAPGQTITDATPILGTVQFEPGQAAFYKLEIRGGQFGSWTTIGATHGNSVVNGQLETLPGPPGLIPGSYELRLVVVGTDSNFVQEPYVVPFNVQ